MVFHIIVSENYMMLSYPGCPGH